MTKDLEALERIKNAPTIYVGCASDIYTRYSFECNEIEKTLKALEIIKEKSIDVHSFLIGINLNTYEDFIQKGRKYGWYTNEPTKEQYDLLKEVML